MNARKIKDEDLVPIIGDGAIGSPIFGDGRLIPVLIIDFDTNRALRDLIHLHENTQPGDAIVTWGHSRFFRFNNKYVYLVLDFTRPSEVTAAFKFDVDRQGGLVDGIINACGVYLQPKESGLRVVQGLDEPKILVEIPASADLPNWDEIYNARLVKQFRRQGLSRTQAKLSTREHRSRLLEIWRGRMGRVNPKTGGPPSA
jgi:hypothetical protein